MKKKILLILTIFGLLSCANDDTAESKAAYEMQLQEQLEAITNLASSGNCNEDTDCDYLAYGSKACGGPTGYVVFSTAIDVDLLKEMIEDYTKLEEEYNIKFGIISDCSIVSPLFITGCLDNQCAKMIE